MNFVWGRECKLGWGWNESLEVFVPVQGGFPNVTSETKNEWVYYIPKKLLSADIGYQVSLFSIH